MFSSCNTLSQRLAAFLYMSFQRLAASWNISTAVKSMVHVFHSAAISIALIKLHCRFIAMQWNGTKITPANETPQIEWGPLTKNGGMPKDKGWTIAGDMTAHQVHNGVQTLKFHYSGMVTFKYILESGSIDDGPVIYRHCNNQQPQIAFRYTAMKVVQVEVDEVINAFTWKLSVSSPIAGHVGWIPAHIRAPWKAVVTDIRNKLGLEKKHKLTLLDDKSEIITARGNCVLKNVLKVPASSSSKRIIKRLSQDK